MQGKGGKLMDWITSLRKAIDYMEEHILDNISAQDVAEHVYISPLYLQKGFQIMTGYSVSEYIRNRKLYLAAQDVISAEEKVIDIAFKYGYDTPESFSKAFTRFHGVSPTHMRKYKTPVSLFLPLKISIVINGGDKMDYSVTKMFGFKVIGFARNFTFENAYHDIPLFWDEICEKYAYPVYSGNPPKNPQEKAIMSYCIGEYGVCIDSPEDRNGFRYMIAGKYTGGEVPEGMEVYEFPQSEWVRFDCIGPMPESLQTLNTRIFNEWLPNNPEFEINGNVNIEWYSCEGEKTDADYKSGIWIPVKRK
ncbi:MAG: effector binding domain-containing protein [Porcipelethomonas sp.]